MKRLIVNADDFGLAESVNDGIIAAHDFGILTSASLLANGSAFGHAIAASLGFLDLSLGVHLNLSSGTPVSDAALIPTLVNQRGKLYMNPITLGMGLLRRRIRLEDVRAEFRAQVTRVFDAGVAPTHLDGHLHVHVLPQIAPLVIEIAREFGIRCIRCPAEDLETTLPSLWRHCEASLAALKRSAIAYGVTSLAQRFREQLRAAGLVCPDAFCGLAHTGFLNTRTLSELLASIKGGITELMCHPGYASAELQSSGGDLTNARESEVVALTAPEIRRTMERLGIRLISFRDI
jgi:hopanoid biosynthesis associated protein HpnK